MKPTLNLHTDGNEYYISGSTTEYVGYYNTIEYTNANGSKVIVVSSERAPIATSISLVAISNDAKTYKGLTTPLPEPIRIFVPSPTDADYKRGWFNRYFARQANDKNAQYREIDEIQYNEIIGGQKPLYVGVQLRWKISGPQFDIIDSVTLKVIEPGVSNTNDRSIKLIETQHRMLRFRLQNLIEYWSGERPAYFGPPLQRTPDGLAERKPERT